MNEEIGYVAGKVFNGKFFPVVIFLNNIFVSKVPLPIDRYGNILPPESDTNHFMRITYVTHGNVSNIEKTRKQFEKYGYYFVPLKEKSGIDITTFSDFPVHA